MKLIPFPEQTIVIAKDQPEYLPLPAFQFANDLTGRVACCWQLTPWERIKLLFTGKLWHTVRTFHERLQPQLLELKKPFTPEDIAATQKQITEELTRKNFFVDMTAKYGGRIRERQKLHDLRGYHPNDRRRSIKFEAEDFERAKELGILFLLGARITNDEYESAVK